jgi:hypothetical protein
MEFQITDLLERYGGTVVACSVECSGRGKRIAYCQYIASGEFDDISSADLRSMRKEVRAINGMWVDAIIDHNQLKCGSKLYKKHALKIDNNRPPTRLSHTK